MNVGSLFRIADAFGIEKIYLSGTSAVPPDRQIAKTARSTDKTVPFSYSSNPLPIIEKLKSDGYTIVSLEKTSGSIDFRKLPLTKSDKACLILGSENYGVCQELLDASDQTIHIAMFGQNSSMNVATACAVAAFELIGRFLDDG